MLNVQHHTVILHLRSHELSVHHFWRSPLSIAFWKDWLFFYSTFHDVSAEVWPAGVSLKQLRLCIFSRGHLRRFEETSRTGQRHFQQKRQGETNNYHWNRFDSVIFSFVLSLDSVKLPGKNIKEGKFEWQKFVVFVTNESLPVRWECIFGKIKLSLSISNSINRIPHCFWLRTFDY